MQGTNEKPNYSHSEIASPDSPTVGHNNINGTNGTYHRHAHPTAQPSIALSPEQYERLFFQPAPADLASPKNHTLTRQFGNPTPLGVVSFLLCLTPTACFLMAFDGTTASSGVALTGVYYLIGGLGMFVCGVLEWVLGNTFPFVVFSTFGGFWFAFGMLNDPAHAIAQSFQDAGAAGATAYNDGLMFYWIFWAVLDAMYFVGSWRTNLVFVEIFTSLFFTFTFLAAAYDKLGHADTSGAAMMLKVAGGFAMAACIGGWYLAFGLLMEAVAMPFHVPFGDLSTRVLTGKRKGMYNNSDVEGGLDKRS